MTCSYNATDNAAAIDAARRYIERVVADDKQRAALVEQVVAHDPQDTTTAMAAVHMALAGQISADTHAADVAPSVAARIRGHFPQFCPNTPDGTYRGASMPRMAPARMAPPSVDRNPLRFLFRLFGGRSGGTLKRRRRPLQTILLWRHFLLGLLVFLPALGATAYMATVLPHHGGTWLELIILATGFLLFGWILTGFWTATCGYGVLCWGSRYRISSDNPSGEPATPGARTAIVMPIYHEDVQRTFAGIQTAYETVAETGRLDEFDFFVLSDSVDADVVVAEQQAWARICENLDAFGKLFYRRRRARVKRKSGNLADFCRRWGGAYTYMIVFDADSIMFGTTLTELVDRMQANPRVALIQTPPAAVNRDSMLARIQQFATRAYGRMFAAGLHFWHLDNGHYWGHNAIIRIKPFMAHCALPRLPGRGALSGDILSHDFVEAALLSRAGWGVYIAYDLGGSYEEVPPTLLEELGRDRRWCQGNIQHSRLLFSDHLAAAHRALFANGIMAYTSAAIWFVFLLLSSTEAVLEAIRVPDYFPEPGALFPRWPVWDPIWAVSLFAMTGVVLFLPKILGMVLIIRNGRQKDYGGVLKLVLSTLIEIVLTMFLAPIRMLTHTWFVASTLIGRQVKWNAQQRGDRQVPWLQALKFHSPGMLLAIVWGGVLYYYTPGFLPWLAPILLPLIVAPAITVFSSRADVGCWLRRRRLQLIPEEADPPSVLRRVSSLTADAPPSAHFVDAVVDPVVNALHVGLQGSARHFDSELAEQRHQLAEDAFNGGPNALAGTQRRHLLADPAQMAALHARIWNEQPDVWAAWL